MIVLGFDPGTKSPGYAIVKFEASTPSLITHGVIPITHKEPAARLKEIRSFLSDLIKKHAPDAAGIERLFFAKNRTTALSVAESRGVALELLEATGIIILELAPVEIKVAVAGYGKADKGAMAKMVSLLLPKATLKKDDNAVDAVAIALSAGFKINTQNRLSP